MEIRILKNTQGAGQSAGKKAAALLKTVVLEKDEAWLMAATGQPQMLFYDALLAEDIPWDKTEIFHLGEYCNLPETHPASFKKYIRECFVSHITLKCVYYIDGMSNLNQILPELNIIAAEKPIDVGMTGFGENVHITSNDPLVDFECPDAYHIVTSEARCKRQQVGEGWSVSIEDVPGQAVSASVPFIYSFQNIVSLIPHQVKAAVVKAVLEAPERGINIPGIALLDHPNQFLYFDHEFTSLLNLPKVKGW